MALNSKQSNNNGIVSDTNVPSVTRVNSRKEETEKKTLYKGPATPCDIYSELNKYVVGQPDAKKAVSIAAANHLKRILIKDPSIKKSNVMLIGPTGCGKTHLISSLAKVIDVPFASISASSLTAAGYVGGDVEDCLRELIRNASQMKVHQTENQLSLLPQAQYNIERAERGIILIDEVDKIRKMSERGKDIGGEAVQQGLLTMIEGTRININLNGSRNYNEGNGVTIDTSNILFVFGGAFPAITDIVRNRLTCEGRNAFEMSEDDLYAAVKDTDLETFGLIPEFIGRIPVIANIRSLSVDDFARIFTEPQDAIFKQLRTLFMADGAQLNVTKELIQHIAQEAKAKNRGARGLRTVTEELFEDAQFISGSFPHCGLEFFMTLFSDGEPGTIVKASQDVAERIRDMIDSGEYGHFLVEIAEAEESDSYKEAI